LQLDQQSAGKPCGGDVFSQRTIGNTDCRNIENISPIKELREKLAVISAADASQGCTNFIWNFFATG